MPRLTGPQPGTDGPNRGSSMTDQELYDQMNADPAAEPPGLTQDDLEAAGLGGPKPTDAEPEPEPDPEPTPDPDPDDEPGEEEPDPDAEPTEEDPDDAEPPLAERPVIDLYGEDRDWDKERQQKDQELANEKKRAEELALKVAELQAQQEASAQETPGEPDESEKLTKAALDAAEALNDDSTADDHAAVVKALALAVAARPAKKGESAEAKAMRAELAALKQSMEARDQAERLAEQRAAQAAVNADLEAHLQKLDAKYTGAFREEAYKAIKKELAKEGFIGENRASLLAHKLLFDKIYEALAKKHPKKVRARRSGRPRLAPGKGAGAVPTLEAGSLEEVAKQALAKGMFKPRGG